MKSSFERYALLAGLLVLVASLQFVCGIGGALLALPAALVLGVGATLLWFHFDLPASRPWLPPLLLAAVVLLASVVLELGFKPDSAEWLAFVAAGLGSGVAVMLRLRNRARCNLCNCRLASQALRFRCPRCSQQVCEETCWNFEHRRCALCLEQRVPVLPMESAWWTRVAGPRAVQGRCQVCQAAADQADLRACPRCRRPQCRDCWDFRNGECARCGAALPELPASLGEIVASVPGTTY
jgi:hypothetical protein